MAGRLVLLCPRGEHGSGALAVYRYMRDHPKYASASTTIIVASRSTRYLPPREGHTQLIVASDPGIVPRDVHRSACATVVIGDSRTIRYGIHRYLRDMAAPQTSWRDLSKLLSSRGQHAACVIPNGTWEVSKPYTVSVNRVLVRRPTVSEAREWVRRDLARRNGVSLKPSQGYG